MHTVSVNCPRCGNPVVFSLQDNITGSKSLPCRKGCGHVTIVYRVSRGQIYIDNVK